MTWGDYRTFVKSFVTFNGKPAVSSNAEWDTAIARYLDEYCETALCLYTDNNAIETTDGWLHGTPPIYDLLDTTLYTAGSDGYARRVVWPVSVVVSDRVLRNLAGRHGPVTVEEMHAMNPYGQATTTSVTAVKYWSFRPDKKIRLFRQPATGFNSGGVKTGVIPGWYLHPKMTNDAHVLHLPGAEEHPSACWVAARVMQPNAQGSALEKMAALSRVAREHFMARARQAIQMVGSTHGPNYATALMINAAQEAQAA